MTVAQLTLDQVAWTAPEPDDYSPERLVLNLLQRQPAGCPVEREGFVFWTGLSDREVRRAIANLRDAGHIIVDVPGGGYRLGDREQALACADRLERRARTELARAQKMRTAAGRAA